eukprot:SAG22_NODE_6405_length_860_cov_3.846255_1_plen_45_part_10
MEGHEVSTLKVGGQTTAVINMEKTDGVCVLAQRHSHDFKIFMMFA